MNASAMTRKRDKKEYATKAQRSATLISSGRGVHNTQAKHLPVCGLAKRVPKPRNVYKARQTANHPTIASTALALLFGSSLKYNLTCLLNHTNA
jgi:hypothetical protein